MTAARGFEYYGQSTPIAPTVTAAAPPVQPARPQATAKRTYWTRTANDRLITAGAYLLVFVGVLFLAAVFDTVHPLVTDITDITVPFCAVVLGGLAAIACGVWRA